jgi:hypothetical protein
MADALAKLRDRRAKMIAAASPTTRTCEGCDLCCSAPPIHEMNKPPGVPCIHLDGEPGQSCSIYAKRPQVCRQFQCLWRMSDQWLPEWAKPSEIGFMLSFNRLDRFPGVVTAHPDPKRPDAWRSIWGQTILSTLATQWNCIVAIGTAPWTGHVVCPDGSCLAVADHPGLVKGGDVGIPSNTFGPDHRPLGQIVRTSAFNWTLSPPPIGSSAK